MIELYRDNNRLSSQSYEVDLKAEGDGITVFN